MTKVAKFINRNIVAIVIIPTIVGVHWGCNRIQNNELLVKETERKDLPIFLAAKYAKESVMERYRGLFGGKE